MENDNGQFDLFEPRKLARSKDPVTSKLAAEQSFDLSNRHRRMVLEALQGMVDGTYYEIADASGLEPPQVMRRLHELQKSARACPTGAMRPGKHKRLCRVWKAIVN